MIDYITQNPDTVATIVVLVVIPFITLLIGILKTTAWGRANAKVLETVLDVVDDVQAEDVKKKIEELKDALPDKEHDALVDKIRTRDPKLKTPTKTEIVKREAMRSIGAHKRQPNPVRVDTD